jgi:hypothetical protein
VTPFPAWIEFHRDPFMRRRVNAHVLYCELVIRPRSFYEPVEVKTLAFATLLGMHSPDLTKALDLLVTHGYLDEAPRAHRKAPRRVTVAFERRPTSQNSRYSPEPTPRSA